VSDSPSLTVPSPPSPPTSPSATTQNHAPNLKIIAAPLVIPIRQNHFSESYHSFMYNDATPLENMNDLS
ncbi:hypothetical protein H0G86_004251, partial [Trichoderma simmonsii]